MQATIHPSDDVSTVATQIVRTFESETGSKLEVVHPMSLLPHAARHADRVALLPDQALRRRFGEFSILVLEGHPNPTTREIGLFDRKDNVWWLDITNELTGKPVRWSAVRDWGHVRLTWTTGSRSVDERWRELVRLLKAAGVH